ncbi:MAG TPA: hypothetical protein VH540_25710 [Ktedonobacterales bacterium]|jgi:hypothetical protein
METSAFNLFEFQRRMVDVIAWYAAKAPITDPENGLRSAELRPPAGLETPTERSWGAYPPDTDFSAQREYSRRAHLEEPKVRRERQEIVNEIARKRRALLTSAQRAAVPKTDVLGGGRLVFYDPDQNLFDGAAESASEGFFDVDNMPPWDLWLAYCIEQTRHDWWNSPGETYLLAWVPPDFLELANAGIAVNPEECVVWAETVEAETLRLLRGAGFLAPEPFGKRR